MNVRLEKISPYIYEVYVNGVYRGDFEVSPKGMCEFIKADIKKDESKEA